KFLGTFPNFLKATPRKNKAIFTIPEPNSQIYILVWIEKVLQKGGGTAEYLKPKIENIQEVQQKVAAAWKYLNHYRTPLMWSFEPLFIKNEESSRKSASELPRIDTQSGMGYNLAKQVGDSFNRISFDHGDSKGSDSSRSTSEDSSNASTNVKLRTGLLTFRKLYPAIG